MSLNVVSVGAMRGFLRIQILFMKSAELPPEEAEDIFVVVVSPFVGMIKVLSVCK